MKLSVILSTVPTKHPLRVIRTMSDDVLDQMSADLKAVMKRGDFPSTSPPKVYLRALLIGAIYSIKTERQLLDHINFNLLFRWFVGLPVEADIWTEEDFASRRAVLIESGVADLFFSRTLSQPRISRILGSEHFLLDEDTISACLSGFIPLDSHTESFAAL